MDNLENNRALLLYYVKLCASFQIHWWIQTGFTGQKCSIRVEIGDILSCVTFLEIWWVTLENNKAPLLCYFKLCVSFRTHWWIQIWVTVRKHLIWVKIDNFLSRVTSKLDRWPWKTKGHLFYDTLSFVHHFMPSVNSNLNNGPEMLNSGQNWPFFEPCHLENLWMTLKNKRAPLLCYLKLCASFCTH